MNHNLKSDSFLNNSFLKSLFAYLYVIVCSYIKKSGHFWGADLLYTGVNFENKHFLARYSMLIYLRIVKKTALKLIYTPISFPVQNISKFRRTSRVSEVTTKSFLQNLKVS